MGATKIGSIGRAIVARAVRFAVDGLEGPAHEEARESLELRLEDAEGRRRSLENDVLTLREQLGEAESNRARMKAGLDAVRAQRDFAFSRAERAEAAESACRELRKKDPACLVARAVALGCDVSVYNDGRRWNIEVWDNERSVSFDCHDLPADDVPATLSRLLDEVEAARKVVQR